MIAAQNSRFPFKATLPLQTNPTNSRNASASHSTAGTNGRSQLDWTGGSSGPCFQGDDVRPLSGLAVPSGVPTADPRNSGRAPDESRKSTQALPNQARDHRRNTPPARLRSAARVCRLGCILPGHNSAKVLKGVAHMGCRYPLVSQTKSPEHDTKQTACVSQFDPQPSRVSFRFSSGHLHRAFSYRACTGWVGASYRRGAGPASVSSGTRRWPSSRRR